MSTTSLSSGPLIESYNLNNLRSSIHLSTSLLSDAELAELYLWVDAIPLSRPKKNFTRDFSDACLFAEVIHAFYPKLVDLHNYPSANSTTQKIYNWNTLNYKVLRKLNHCLTEETIHQIVQCKPGIVEKVLFEVKQKLTSMTLPRKSSDNHSNFSLSSDSSLKSQSSLLPSISNLEKKSEASQENSIATLHNTIALLQGKIEKLELLLRLKDQKIEELSRFQPS